MKIKHTILSSVALGSAALMLSPAETQGFSLLGHSLGQGQRDFRIFNDFADTASNNNTTEEANFPGYTGAVLAFWKGVVEWGSGPHGNGGSSDPTQAIIGDGGANFDPSFQGEATSVGGGSSNIISPLAGSSGGVFAFMTGGSGGWRIRFYEGWTWADGPAGIGGGQGDLQGIGCHEYGHALGLNHSGNFGATMFASTSTGATGTRSINADDSAGVQAIYGAKSASKPEITGLTVNGSSVTIDGFNFAASGNEVWFTQAGAGGSGTPVKVTGVSSSGGGTEITVGVPTGAGDGDVLVQSGSGNSGLSNAWPIDTDGTVTPEPLSVASVSPTQIPALTPTNDQTFTLNGTGFTNVTDITIDGQTLSTFPKTWTVINDNIINFELNPLDEYGITSLGNYTIEVFDPTSSDTINVEIIAPSPTIRLGSGDPGQFFITGFPTPFHMGGNPDNVHFMWTSLNLGFTPFPGLFDLDIGNSDYGSLILGFFTQLGSNGNATVNITLPATVAGATFYWQSVEYDLGTGALPIPASNVSESFILF